MNQSDYFSLMLDETTHCTVTEQLAIHGRFIDVDTEELKSHYLKIIDLLQPETVEDCDTQLDISISVNAETIANRSLASRPFASAFTLGRGGGKVWGLLTRFHGP